MKRVRTCLASALILVTVNVTSPLFADSVSGGDTLLSRLEENRIAEILTSVSGTRTPHGRIVAISRHFLGSPYADNPLAGGLQKKEALVVNLKAFDCFTFLDTVEALRRSRDTESFPDNLIAVRYKDRDVSYLKRRHFFSDWVAEENSHLVDMTETLAPDSIRKTRKDLNQRTDESFWVPGLPVFPRTITYIPSSVIDQEVLDRLRDGDYVGFYTSKPGLDVSHTGLIVKMQHKVLLRHASSLNGQEVVRDEGLAEYMQSHEGLIVYRAR